MSQQRVLQTAPNIFHIHLSSVNITNVIYVICVCVPSLNPNGQVCLATMPWDRVEIAHKENEKGSIPPLSHLQTDTV